MADDILGAAPVTPVVAPVAAVQAPATTAVPVATVPVVPVTPVVAPVVPAQPTEQLLKVEPPKPTIEALKLVKDSNVPKERIDAIVSKAKSVEEAQSFYDLAHDIYSGGAKAMELQNQTRLSELKADPELGGQKWEETKVLYQSGMKRLFGDQSIADVVAAKLDALPWLVRGVVRAERAATAKPIIQQGVEVTKPENTLQPHERIYGPDNTYNPLAPNKPLDKPRTTPRF
jgi:hypothetical protein